MYKLVGSVRWVFGGEASEALATFPALVSQAINLLLP